MDGRTLNDKLNYVGMEKAARKLALKEHPDRMEEIATMTSVEVCTLIAEDYEMVYAESEEVGLVKKENIPQYGKIIVRLER